MLAAGASNRFNDTKQLALINGKTMVVASAERLSQTNIDSLSIVLGAKAQAIEKALNQANIFKDSNVKASYVTAENWQQGMGASIAAGVKSLDKKYTHVLIGLSDQVAISSKQFNLMLKVSRERPKNIVAALYNKKLGAPAIFPHAFFSQLAALSNDKGARDILRENAATVLRVDLPEAAQDIDTKSDLLSYISGVSPIK
ncbi:nucleotidyltransferase family protein [Glaciecola sp. 2405UD65-10]|uniref:nucleotidyltransferase family protein n=1 Tax=Glaciecola sp. 2405UD65-10 TaxID=3397244 RepID=UPI003B5CECAA